MKRTCLFFIGPREVELREEELAPPPPGEVQIQSICSAISAGTELLLYSGEAPSKLPADSSLPALSGNLAYPLKYGYSMVGQVIALGKAVEKQWLGRRVFAFNPHESAFNANIGDVQILPEGCPEKDAAFLANMETAVNLMLDGSPRLGERVVVLGQGILGLLSAALLARHPLDALLTFDRYSVRRDFSLKFGAQVSFDPLDSAAIEEALDLLGPRRADLVYELSGRPEALDLALALVGEHGRIVVGSWYGQRRAPIDLGGHFHRGRVKIISSQVSQIEPALSGRWDRDRRFDFAWKMVSELHPSRLVTHQFRLAQASEAYAQLAERPAETLGVLLTYG